MVTKQWSWRVSYEGFQSMCPCILQMCLAG